MMAEPQDEHRWLEQLVGDWTYATEEDGGTAWSEHVRSLEGVWVVAEGVGEMPGGRRHTTLMTLGYDPRTRRFVGTWIGSMMTHLWVYDGELDGTGRVLTLNSEGPDFTGGSALAQYRDVIGILDADNRTLTSWVQGDDGGWTQIMQSHYRRAAPSA
jgi:hypothetical protein